MCTKFYCTWPFKSVKLERRGVGWCTVTVLTVIGLDVVWDSISHWDSCLVDSSWNVMAHGDAREGKWRGNWRMQWVASTLHTTSEHGVSSISSADAHTSAASSRLNWRPHRFKWTRPFRQKTKSGFWVCAITFQLASTTCYSSSDPQVTFYFVLILQPSVHHSAPKYPLIMKIHEPCMKIAKFWRNTWWFMT